MVRGVSKKHVQMEKGIFMNIKKFLVAGLLTTSLFNATLAETITFSSDEPVTVEIDGKVISTVLGGIIQAKTLNINGEKASLPTSLQIGKKGTTTDLGRLVQGVQFNSLKVTSAHGAVTTFFEQDPKEQALRFALPSVFHFTKNADGSFGLNIKKQ